MQVTFEVYLIQNGLLFQIGVKYVLIFKKNKKFG